VKKIVIIAIVAILLTPSIGSQHIESNLNKLPSKDDVIGFLNALEEKSNKLFNAKGEIEKDLIIENGLINGSWFEDALTKFYEAEGIKYNESRVNEFIVNASLPADVQQSIAFLLYTYLNVSHNKKRADNIFSIFYTIRETKYYLEHYTRNGTIIGPYGKIAIGGNSDDSYNNFSFVVDFGGNDAYHGGKFIVDVSGEDTYKAGVAENKTCIFIDFSGKDKYTDACYSYNGSFYLIDMDGNDIYNGIICSSFSNGFSFLFDFRGDDQYKGKDYTQCYSSDGTSALIDFNGDDAYYAANFSQAASSGGFSLLADFFGDDIFIGNSHSQAYATGGSIEGVKGVAILANFAGNDYYKCGNYSQGYSSMMGFSILLDFLGSDIYDANRFSQASSNALGMAALIDNDGKNAFKHGPFCQGYMLGSVSLFMNNFEIRGNEKILEMINRLNFDFGNLFD